MSEHHNIRFSGHHVRNATPTVLKRQACNMYIAPAPAQTVRAEDPLLISWDTSCNPPASGAIDIKLAVSGAEGNIQSWLKLDWSKGSYEANINPQWYGYKSTIALTIGIEEHPSSLFMNMNQISLPFTATFDSQAAVASSSAAAAASATGGVEDKPSRFEWVDNFFKGGLTKGQIAAAVIMPILTVAAVLVAYVFWSRKKEANKRMEWKEKVDQRMSTLSVDWRATTAVGGAAAVRHSIAMSMAERRASSFYTRPTSEYSATPRPVNPNGVQSRSSRISFADSTYRESTSDPIPSVPKLPAAYQKTTLERQTIVEDDSPQAMSPTQRQGAFVLDDDSIRDRLSAASGQKDGRPSIDERDLQRDLSGEPAIAMMRAGNKSMDELARYPSQNEVIFDEPITPITPLAPAVTRDTTSQRTYNMPAYSSTRDSTYFTNAPITDPSAPNPLASDPDEALRAYASRAAAQTQPTQVTATPFAGFAAGPGVANAAGLDMSSPDAIFRSYAQSRNGSTAAINTAPQTTGNVMRTLYGPNSGMSQGLGMTATTGSNNPYRDSYTDGNSIGKAQ